MEFLGYILTRDGIKPQPNKVQSILALAPPRIVKELRRFLGMVQYYRDLWARRSDMLAPLTSLVHPPRSPWWVWVDEVKYHDVLVSEAQGEWETTHLIGIQGVMHINNPNEDIMCGSVHVGTLQNGDLHKVPLPRVPRGQSNSPMATAVTFLENPSHTSYLPDPRIPLYNNLKKLLLDFGKQSMPLHLVGWDNSWPLIQ